jgi:hypothetical protein
MKYFPLLFLVAAVLMISCSKEVTAPTPAPTPVPIDSIYLFRKMRDSCSYTIDGQRYDADYSSSGFRIGTAGANLDTINHNWRWSADTTQFFVGYSISNIGLANAPNYTNMEIIFAENFNNRDLAVRKLPSIRVPTAAEQLKMYSLGNHPFALDYKRTNYQSGIAIAVIGANRTYWISYIDAYAYGPTSIPYNSQANAVFEVIRLQKLSDIDLDYLLEARFSANVYGRGEEVKKVEKGYIRLHLRDY